MCDKPLSPTALAAQVGMVESRLQGLSDLGLTDEAVADMLSQSPTLLGYHSKQLQAMREALGGHVGLSRTDVASLLQKEPRILSYSVAGVLGDLFYTLLCNAPSTTAGGHEVNLSLRRIHNLVVTTSVRCSALPTTDAS